jgi:hypothetical protein
VTAKTEIAEVFEKAADILETVGWCQHQKVQWSLMEDGSIQPAAYCAAGALQAAAGLSFSHVTDYDEFRPNPYMEAIKTVARRVGNQVPRWNDRIVKDASEVIDTFKTIAKDLRNEAEPDA